VTPARVYDDAAQRLDELGREASGRLPWTFQPEPRSRFGALVDADGDVVVERIWEPDALLLAAVRAAVPLLVDELHRRSDAAREQDRVDDLGSDELDPRWLDLARAITTGGTP